MTKFTQHLLKIGNSHHFKLKEKENHLELPKNKWADFKTTEQSVDVITIGGNNVGKQALHNFQVSLHWAFINFKYNSLRGEKSGDFIIK